MLNISTISNPSNHPILGAAPTPEGIFLVIIIENIEKQCPITANAPAKGPNKIVGMYAFKRSKNPPINAKNKAIFLLYFSFKE
ncbi:MAG: hypothetical protein QXQ16_02440 [Candidatus Aenigmatarchaeota archaeon]